MLKVTYPLIVNPRGEVIGLCFLIWDVDILIGENAMVWVNTAGEVPPYGWAQPRVTNIVKRTT
jgi:hypothetical protein